METLQSNKLIRRETDTPVRYRMTEAEGTEWKGDTEDRRRSGRYTVHAHKKIEITVEEWGVGDKESETMASPKV